jgi:hypothetical protein
MIKPARLLLKTLALFMLINVLFMAFDPVPGLARVSLYNSVFPGRERLPWGERPDLAGNLTLNNLDAMFASHTVSQPKAADEFRVLLVGDSSTWGFLLKPQDTLSGLLNTRDLRRDGKRVRVFNIGYPDFSVSKDALLLDYARRYQPDLVIWLVTLRSLPRDAQAHPLLTANQPRERSLWGRTLLARRRELVDLIRLQVLGLTWAATGVDQHYPARFEPALRDLDADETFRGLQPGASMSGTLALEVIAQSRVRLGSVPLVLVNEPILISTGANSAVRYNAFYPRWAYDQYREMLRKEAAALNQPYVDLWDSVPESEFTNSAVHVTPAGSRIIADQLAAIIERP